MTVDWGRNDSELAGGWPGACDIGADSIRKTGEGARRVQIWTLTDLWDRCLYGGRDAGGGSAHLWTQTLWRCHEKVALGRFDGDVVVGDERASGRVCQWIWRWR